MAAILTPARHRPPAPPRPRLALVPAPTTPARRAGAPRVATRPVAVPAPPSTGVLAGVVLAATVAVLLALAIAHGAFAAAVPAAPGASGAAPAVATGPAGGPTVTVEPGDTVWSIARRLQPEGDVRPLVDRIVASRGSTVVVAGEELVVPQ